MSAKKNKNTKASDTAKPSDTPESIEIPEIIEAEVVSESSIPNDKKSSSAPLAKKSGKFPWVISLILASFIAGLYLQPHFERGLVYVGLASAPRTIAAQSPSGQTVDLIPLVTRMELLEARLSRLEPVLPMVDADMTALKDSLKSIKADIDLIAGTTPIGDSGDIKTKMDKLQADLTALTTVTANVAMAPAEDITRLEGALVISRANNQHLTDRMQLLEQSIEAMQNNSLEANPRGRLLLALGRMSAKLNGGADFSADLDALMPDIEALPALIQGQIGDTLSALRSYSAGVDRLDILRGDFDDLLRAIKTAEAKENESFLADFLTVRRSDETAEGTDKTLYLAETYLVSGDLHGAVEQLKTLGGAAQKTATPWITRAMSRLKALALKDKLSRLIAGGGA